MAGKMFADDVLEELRFAPRNLPIAVRVTEGAGSVILQSDITGVVVDKENGRVVLIGCIDEAAEESKPEDS